MRADTRAGDSVVYVSSVSAFSHCYCSRRRKKSHVSPFSVLPSSLSIRPSSSLAIPLKLSSSRLSSNRNGLYMFELYLDGPALPGGGGYNSFLQHCVSYHRYGASRRHVLGLAL